MKISKDGVLTKIEIDDIKEGKLEIPEGVRKIEFEELPSIDERAYSSRYSAPLWGVINRAVASMVRAKQKK